MRHVIQPGNIASDVWADTAYRSKANDGWLDRNMRSSRIHRCKSNDKANGHAARRYDNATCVHFASDASPT